MERSTVVGVFVGNPKLTTKLTFWKGTPRAKVCVVMRIRVLPVSNNCKSRSRTSNGMSFEYQLIGHFGKCVFSQSMSDFFYTNKKAKNALKRMTNFESSIRGVILKHKHSLQ